MKNIEKSSNLLNLKKSQSHLNKVIEMVEGGSYCIDTMQQVLAVIGLLKSVNQTLLAQHLNSCFAHAVGGSNQEKKKTMINEILRLQKMSNK